MRRSLFAVGCVLSVSLLALLAYSLHRTSWAFTIYEGDSTLGFVAALTLEFALVGFIAGRAVAEVLPLADDVRKDILRWAGRGLVSALCVHVVVNLTAGYVRGGGALLEQLGGSQSAYAVAAVMWLVVNAIVPALIFWLSEMLARVVRVWLVTGAPGAPLALHSATEQHHGAPLVSIQQVVAPQLAPTDEDDEYIHSPEDRMAQAVALVREQRYTPKRAARETGAPESTLRRRLQSYNAIDKEEVRL